MFYVTTVHQLLEYLGYYFQLPFQNDDDDGDIHII
jgi:hypothetical protein